MKTLTTQLKTFRRCRISICTLILALLCLQATAQGLRVKGSVEDTQGKAIPDAHIMLYDRGDTLRAVETTVSDNGGRFALEGIPAGDYRLVASSVQYDKAVVEISNLREDVSSLVIRMEDKVKTLEGVTVQADPVIRELDRQIIFPGKREREESVNGVELIDKLYLGKVYVDKRANTIQGMGGGKVELRVNGAPADISDIMSVDPKLVTRVEYHDRPSMRYGDATAVVDLYVRRWNTGGRVNLYAQNRADGTAWGTGRGSVKLNHGRSEFSLSGFYSYMSEEGDYFTRRESFLFEDGSRLSRGKEGLPYTSRERMYTLNAAYSYYKPGNLLFVANLYHEFFNTPNSPSRSRISVDGHPGAYTLSEDSSAYRERRPSFELYLQKDLRNRQLVALDVVGTYLGTSSLNRYRETDAGENSRKESLADITGEKYSIIAEGIYERRFDRGKLSVGAKETASFADNDYRGTFDHRSRMDQYVTNARAEWSGNPGKLSYGLGLGGTLYNTAYADKRSSSFHLDPRLTLGYDLSRALSLYYVARLGVRTPEIGSLSDTQVAKDNYNVLRGNPDLKTVRNYSNTLSVYLMPRSLSVFLDIGYDHTLDPILTETYREGKRFISIFENGKRSQEFSLSGFARWKAVPDFLDVYGRFGYRRVKNVARTYAHSLDAWNIDAGADATYKRITLGINLHKDIDLLSSESVTYRGYQLTASLDYRWKGLRVGCNAGWNLNRTMTRDVNLNRYAYSEHRLYTPETRFVFNVKLSWAFDFGRPGEESYQLLQNKDEVGGVLK